MRLLGVDIETSGLDPKTDRITEVGAVLWSTERKKPIYLFSEYLNDKQTFQPLPKEVVELTGITDDDITEFGVTPARVFTILNGLMAKAEYVVAHNGTSFDKPFLMEQFSKARIPFPVHIPWIDTKVDVPYLEKIATRKLTHLAAEHGFLNPFAHRAVFDVLTMLSILENYDLEQVIAYSKVPNVVIRAMVVYEDKDKAKAKNFFWDGKNKWWIKVIKECDYEKEAAACDFKVAIVQNDSNG